MFGTVPKLGSAYSGACAIALSDIISCINTSSSANADAVDALKLSDDHPNDAEEGSPAGEKIERDHGSSGINKQ